MRIKSIICDVDMMYAFHNYVLFLHFKFFQGGPVAGYTPSRYMIVQYVLMIQGLGGIDEEKLCEYSVFTKYATSLNDCTGKDTIKQDTC